MKIDGNELAIKQNELDQQGHKKEAYEMKMEFLRQVRESGDHCPCQEACPHHGNCFECVTIHRGHRDHRRCVCGIWSTNALLHCRI